MPESAVAMTKPLTASQALAELADQHAALRSMMERCDDLADELDNGHIGSTQLLREVARLRIAFDEHNKFEENLLHPLLLDVDWLGAVRVARMVEEHIAEHRSMRRHLGSTPSPTSELRAVIDSLRAHLDNEERYFLSQRVLRDDLAG